MVKLKLPFSQLLKRVDKYLNPNHVLLDSAAILEILGPWREPDDTAAREATKHEWDHHDLYDVLRTPTRDLKDFGHGHLLYFYFVKWMCTLFMVLSLLCGIPQIIVNGIGAYYMRGDIELSTLGNFGLLWSSKLRAQGMVTLEAQTKVNCSTTCASRTEEFISVYFRRKSHAAKLTTGWSKAEALKFCSTLDMLGCFIYLGATFYVIWNCRAVAKQADKNTVTIEDYSVMVYGLPEDAIEESVLEFFSQFGEVAKAELARSYGQLINAAVQRKQLIEKLESAVALVQKTAGKEVSVPAQLLEDIKEFRMQLKETSHHLATLQQDKENTRVVSAIITFADEKGRTECFSKLSSSYLKEFMNRKQQRKTPKFKDKYALHVSAAPQPTDIYYENLERTKLDRFYRHLVTALAKYFCLAVGFYLINLATMMRGAVGGMQTTDAVLCAEKCRFTDPNTGELKLGSADRRRYKQCFGSSSSSCKLVNKCYKCWCTQAIVQGMLSETLYCSAFASNMTLIFVAQVVQVLGITIINLSLQYISTWLTSWEMHHTRSEAERSLCHKLFLLQFLNTAVTTIIANAYMPTMKELIKHSVFKGLFFEGVYSDVTPGWYREVGRALVMSMIVGMVLRVGTVVVRYVKFHLTFKKRLETSLTQSQLVQTWIGPEFSLASRYAELCNQIYVTMCFAAGMPIMYPLTAISFFLTYWAEKYELLKLSRRPILYGTALQDMVGQLLPYAAVWHCASAIWSYSFFGKDPRSAIFSELSVRQLSGVIDGFMGPIMSRKEAQDMAARVLSDYSGHYVLGLLMVLIVLLVENTVDVWAQWGKGLLRTLHLLKSNKEEEELEGIPEFHLAVQSHALVGPTSYAVQANPNYIAAFKPMAHEEERAAFEDKQKSKLGEGKKNEDEDANGERHRWKPWKPKKQKSDQKHRSSKKHDDSPKGKHHHHGAERSAHEEVSEEEAETTPEADDAAPQAAGGGDAGNTPNAALPKRKRKGRPEWMIEMFELHRVKPKSNQVAPAASLGMVPASFVHHASAATEGIVEAVDGGETSGQAANTANQKPKGFFANVRATVLGN